MFNAVKFEVKNCLVFYKYQSLEEKNWNFLRKGNSFRIYCVQ